MPSYLTTIPPSLRKEILGSSSKLTKGSLKTGIRKDKLASLLNIKDTIKKNKKSFKKKLKKPKNKKQKLPSWSLIVSEPGYVQMDPALLLVQYPGVSGQFPPDDFTVTRSEGGNWGEVTSTGAAHPILHFLSGKLVTITFNAMFVSDERNDVEEKMSRLMLLTRIDAFLGRPPICLFTYGSEMTMKCIVDGVSTGKWQVQPNGSLRYATCSITLKKFIEVRGPTNIPLKQKFPVYKTATLKPGETMSQLAKRIYGRSDWGNCLKNMYPLAEVGSILRTSPKSVNIDRKGKPLDMPTPEWMSAHCKGKRRKMGLSNKKLKKKNYLRDLEEIKGKIENRRELLLDTGDLTDQTKIKQDITELNVKSVKIKDDLRLLTKKK